MQLAAQTPACHLYAMQPALLRPAVQLNAQLYPASMGIDAEIAESLELMPDCPLFRVFPQRRFRFRVRNYFQRVRIQVVGEVLAFFQFSGILFREQLVVDAHL